jgi:ABC-type transport system involved in multi-copper enzyme maturation permease subunit
VEKRSIYALLSKPVERYQLVLGKYVGLLLTLAVNLSVMAAAIYLVLAAMRAIEGPGIAAGLDTPLLDPALLKAVGLTLVELAVVTAIALFFSTFSSPMLSAAFTLGLWVAGRFSDDLRNFNQVIDSPAAAWLARGLYYLLPNFAQFDVRAQVVHGLPVPLGYMALATAYGATYILALLVAAITIFSRRDFK